MFSNFAVVSWKNQLKTTTIFFLTFSVHFIFLSLYNINILRKREGKKSPLIPETMAVKLITAFRAVFN